MLEVTNLQAGYENLQVLWDVSLTVKKGEFVALIGSNGAGKTTTLRTIAGLIKPQNGEIRFLDKAITNIPPHRISQLGLSYITEDLNLFEAMTVHENLMMGAYSQRNRKNIKTKLDYVFQLFPRLGERQKQLAGTLSGGERRMLALGRGLMSDPHLLLIDEPSLGLAPKLVLSVFEALKVLHSQGLTILLVEQNVNNTLHITDKAYVLEHGKIVLHGSSTDLLQDAFLKETYMGRR